MKTDHPSSKANATDSDLDDFISERVLYGLSLAMPSDDPYWDDLAFYVNSHYGTAYSGTKLRSIVTYFGRKKELSVEEIQCAALAASRNYFCSKVILDQHTLSNRAQIRNGLSSAL